MRYTIYKNDVGQLMAMEGHCEFDEVVNHAIDSDVANRTIAALETEIKRLKLDLADAEKLTPYAEYLAYLVENNYTVVAGISTFWVAEIDGTKRVGQKCDTIREAIETFKRNNP